MIQNARLSLRKIDDATIIAFISACLAAEGTERSSIQQLTVSLAKNESQEHASILEKLSQTRNEEFAQIANRYGIQGLWRNIFRFSFAKQMEQSLADLLRFATALVEASPIHFNRHAAIDHAGLVEERVLMPALLLDFAEFSYETLGNLKAIQQKTRCLIAANIETEPSTERLDFDSKLQRQLDFGCVVEDHLPFASEQILVLRAFHQFEYFFIQLREFVRQLERNHELDAQATLTVSLDILVSKLPQFNHIPKSRDLNQLESCRFAILESWQNFGVELASVLSRIETMIRKAPPTSELSPFATLTQNLRRSVARTMIKHGISAVKAEEATIDLISYCNNHTIRPAAIIPAELAKINPCLNVSSLDTFKKLDEQSYLGLHDTDRKKLLVSRHRHLSSLLAGLITMCVAVMFIGCGAKLAPKSDIIDYRAPISYRSPKAINEQEADHEQKNR